MIHNYRARIINPQYMFGVNYTSFFIYIRKRNLLKESNGVLNLYISNICDKINHSNCIQRGKNFEAAWYILMWPLLSWFSLLYYVHGIGFFIQFSLAKGVLHAGRGSYIYFSYSTGAPLADIKLIILGFFCYSVFNNFFCYIKKFSYI